MKHHTEDMVCSLCEDKLKEAHPYLVSWFHEIKSFKPNIHVSCAHRGEKEQTEAYIEGKTNAKYPDSPHNKEPAEALDVFFLISGKAFYPPKEYVEINEYNKKVHALIAWGGNFRTIGDGNHYQLTTKVDV